MRLVASPRRLNPVQTLGGAWFLLLAVIVIWGIRLQFEVASIGTLWPSLLAGLCLACFYMILGALIMMRPPATAQAAGLLPKLAAFAGTYLPWTITFFSRTDQVFLNLLSLVCVITGTIMMLLTICHLGKAFSLVPQARFVVQSGPYRWIIRHPLYLSEEIAIIGTALQFLSPITVMIVALHLCVQVCRIHYEESLLRRTCPEYAAYAFGRWRLVPYVW
jgi:hypothetical protein